MSHSVEKTSSRDGEVVKSTSRSDPSLRWMCVASYAQLRIRWPPGSQMADAILESERRSASRRMGATNRRDRDGVLVL